jgi:TolB-like protein/tetratricopeptide (TPR) repeat protein
LATILRFNGFDVDLAAGQILKRGVRVRLREKSFQVLALLLEHAGQVVTREELQRRLWPDDVFVDFANNLNTAVGRLREALGDSAEHPRFIETLPKRGYRFIGSLAESPSPPEHKPPSRVRIVVLPFLNLSGDAGQEYFSDAMTEEVITELAALAPKHLDVIARTTAMRYKRTNKDVARIGRELHVDHVVEGGVRQEGDHVAVTVQLIRASDQMHLFARRYEADLPDVFSVRTSIAEALAAHIAHAPLANALAVRMAAMPPVRRPTENLAAFQVYSQGRHYLEMQFSDGLVKAKQCFEEAVARDPSFALAHDALAEIFSSLGFFGAGPPRTLRPVAIMHVQRALELDPDLAEAHALLGWFGRDLGYGWPEIFSHVARSLELKPASPDVRFRCGMVLLMAGRIGEAIAELEQALEWDPLSAKLHGWLSNVLYHGRQYDRALQQARLAADIEPEGWVGPLMLGLTYCAKQMFEEGVAAMRRGCALCGDAPFMLGWLGLALGQAGSATEARALLERVHAMAATQYVLPTTFAWIYLGLGETDSAFEWMDRAADAYDTMLAPIKSFPFLDPLRDDPRYHALLRKMKLDQESGVGIR